MRKELCVSKGTSKYFTKIILTTKWEPRRFYGVQIMTISHLGTFKAKHWNQLQRQRVILFVKKPSQKFPWHYYIWFFFL